MLLVGPLLHSMCWGFAVGISAAVGYRWVGTAELVGFLWVSGKIGNLFAGTAESFFADRIAGLNVAAAMMLWSAC